MISLSRPKWTFLASLTVAWVLSTALAARAEKVAAPPPRKTDAAKFDAQAMCANLHYFAAVGLTGTWHPLALVWSADYLRQDREALAFWMSPRRAQAATAAQIVAQQNPYSAFVIRVKGKDLAVWHEDVYILDHALPLEGRWLNGIRDGTPMPDFRKRAGDKKRRDEIAIHNAYLQALRYSVRVPLDAFEKSAQDNKYVTFAHLWNQSAKYRGQVIPIEGRLKRLRRYDAPSELRKQGIQYLYEGWVFGPTPGSHPYCVLFPIAASDASSKAGFLEPAEDMERWVTFYGYYLKKLRYRSGDGDKDAPLLIGPTVIPMPAPPPPPIEPPMFNRQVLAMLVGFTAAIIALLVFLTWWFRRGDRQFQRRMAELHNARVADMLEKGSHETYREPENSDADIGAEKGDL